MKIIAFYLPQFHEIPENNRWWGKGFTEWSNVKRGHPFYRGHYQPRKPLNRNYYNLLNQDILKWQSELAERYGVDGFCFYHYYFVGKKLLEKPAEILLNNKEIQMPFCFSWANQSWARTWYRKKNNNTILLKQQYGEKEDWRKHFYYLLPFFQDERYIKYEGKPLFLIYISKDFAKCDQMINYWNELAKSNGLEGVYFISMLTGYPDDNRHKQFDAYAEFEPMNTYKQLNQNANVFKKLKTALLSRIGLTKLGWMNKCLINSFSYAKFARNIINRNYFKGDKTVYYGAFSGWDNTPRKDEDGLIIKNGSPAKFYDLVKKQREKSLQEKKEFLFINAWNEWSEGAYLEPDEKYGYAYLKAIKKALGDEKL